MSTAASPPVGSSAEGPPPRRAHGARIMFSVLFSSTMSDTDIARLARTLNLDTHLHPKLHDSPISPGVARLDFDSGLFLLREAQAGRWVLEGRTWGHPPPQIIRQWHLCAAEAARQLDSTVTVPWRPAADELACGGARSR
jgi:hypothetical protein